MVISDLKGLLNKETPKYNIEEQLSFSALEYGFNPEIVKRNLSQIESRNSIKNNLSSCAENSKELL